MYSPQEINLIKNLLYSPVPHKCRATFWLIASGARREKVNNPNYYNNLLKTYPKEPEFQAFEMIRRDIKRTFPAIPFFKEEANLIKLENILKAFAMRNTSIGYCQGFNYIVGKMLMLFEDEENTFWLFTCLVESYLPFDFYITFSGVRTDVEVLKKIIKNTFPDIDQTSEICISNLITKCLISLFSQNVSIKVLYTIWDYLFIYGSSILYRAFIWSIYLLYDKSLKKLPIEKLHSVLLSKLAQEEDLGSLCFFLTQYTRVGDNFIKFNRKKISKKQFAENNQDDDDDCYEPEMTTQKKCDIHLPFCLYFKGLRGDEENYCLKCSKKSFYMIDDYFFDNLTFKKEEKEVTIDDMLIERQFHYCQDEFI